MGNPNPSPATRFKKGNKLPAETLKKISEKNKGNKSRQKLKTKELRQLAYASYCDWIAQGHSMEAWSFEHPDISLTKRSIEKYIRDYPDELPIIKKEIAIAKSLKEWETKGLRMMIGQIEKCQPAIYQMFMRNKFGWDKEGTGQKEGHEPLIQKIANKWRSGNVQ